MDAEETALIRTIRDRPGDTTARLVYADWLDERDHSGAAYLRAEVALSQANEADAPRLRRALLKKIPGLPREWRDRFEQPDLLLAPPVPFRPGWYSYGATTTKAYSTLPNIEPEGLSPDLPWLSGEGVEPRTDQEEYEREEIAALARVKHGAEELRLALPPGFEALARDFARRKVITDDGYHEFFLHDATLYDFPRVGEGHLIVFFGDMHYGASPQLSWALYLVPEVNWHCVVAFPLGDDAESGLPDDPNDIVYCAPSFQAFLYRWWRECAVR